MKAKKLLKTGIITILLLAAAAAGLLFTGVIWRSPKYYPAAQIQTFAVPVMDMKTYAAMPEHARPYIYKITTQGKGSVYVLGIDHTKKSSDRQIDSIYNAWNMYRPDIALVEGRLGFLFSWFQNPVSVYGESGATVQLAKKHSIPYYTWEPERQTEVNVLLQQFDPARVALFYCLRPYISSYRFGKPQDPDNTMLSYIKSRTNYGGIRGLITSTAQIDSAWKKDFPHLKDWRETSDEYGWPEGWLQDIAGLANITRDLHACTAITELVAKNKKVFITMGASHAFRIEQTLREALKNM